MAGSWRDILENAGEHPRIDRDRAPRGQVQYSSPIQQPPRHPSSRLSSGAEARNLLELELRALEALTAEDLPAFLDKREGVQQSKPVQTGKRRHTSLMAALNAVIREPAARLLRSPHSAPLPPSEPPQARRLDAPHSQAAMARREDPRPYLRGQDQLGSFSPRGEGQDEAGLRTSRSRASTALAAQAEQERSARPIILPKRLLSILPSQRLRWRGFLALPLSIIIAGVSGYALVHRGGRDAGTSGTKLAAPATNPSDVLLNVPLPSRRPSVLRAQSRDPARPAAPENGKDADRPQPAPFTLESIFR
jgi:hypothetical protein